MQNNRTTKKIVIIGAGSASFGPTTLATLIRNKALKGSHLALVDLNSQSLAVAAEVARRMIETWGAGMTLSSSTERKEVLPGASHVVVSIEVGPREELWQLDWEIPLRHGLRQPYAENGGPGGLAHAFRQIPPHLAIAADMEHLCPSAWMIVFSNPLPRIVRAVRKYSKIKVVGKCHQIEVGYALCAALLHRQFDISLPGDLALHSDPVNVGVVRTLAEAGRRRLAITSAGLNHFIWLLDIRDRQNGADLYPELRQAIDTAPPTLEPLALELFRLFGKLPIGGDTHLVEYLPWLHDPLTKPHETFGIPLYDWRGNEGVREALNLMMQAMAVGKLPVDGLREAPSEGAAELMVALGGGGRYFDETVNVPNQGAIQGLPDETIVEVPAIVDSNGIRPLQLGPLPPPILELCRREAALVEFAVDAAAHGDRRLALQALLMDPMINDIGRAKAILDEYLEAFADYLPQFTTS
jgi:alpha-galactosidase